MLKQKCCLGLALKRPPVRTEAVCSVLLQCDMVLTYQQMSPLPTQNCAGISNKKQLQIMVARAIRRTRLLLFNCMEAEWKIELWLEPSLHSILFPNAWRGTKKLQSVNFRLGGWVNGMETERCNVACAATGGGAQRLIRAFLVGVFTETSARLASASWHATPDRQLRNCQAELSKAKNCFIEDYSPALLGSWELLLRIYM